MMCRLPTRPRTAARSGRLRGRRRRSAEAMNTRYYVILGTPETQARILTIFNQVFDALGIRALCIPEPTHATPDAGMLDLILRRDGVRGVQMATPQPLELCPPLARTSTEATWAGSVSAIVRDDAGMLSGALFDGVGFVKHLSEQGFAFAGKHILLLGGSPAARAIGASMAAAGARSIDVRDPLQERAVTTLAMLASRFGVAGSADAHVPLSSYSLIVNTLELYRSPRSGSLPVDLAAVVPGTIIADTVLEESRSHFLQAARQRGLPTFWGLPALRDQVRLYLDFFGEVPRVDR